MLGHAGIEYRLETNYPTWFQDGPGKQMSNGVDSAGCFRNACHDIMCNEVDSQ